MTLQEELIETLKLEEAARIKAREAISRLKKIRARRLELEQLLKPKQN